MKSVDDVFVAAGNGEERPRMRDDDKCQTVVEYVRHVLFLDLFQARVSQLPFDSNATRLSTSNCMIRHVFATSSSAVAKRPRDAS